MAYWDPQDSEYLLVRRWLGATRALYVLPDNPGKAWRPGDSLNNLLAKLLRSLCEAFGAADAYRFSDTENDLYRKILAAIRQGIPGLPAGAAYEWRQADSNRELLAKILRCLSAHFSNSDPNKNFLPGDSEVICLRKIVGLF